MADLASSQQLFRRKLWDLQHVLLECGFYPCQRRVESVEFAVLPAWSIHLGMSSPLRTVDQRIQHRSLGWVLPCRLLGKGFRWILFFRTKELVFWARSLYQWTSHRLSFLLTMLPPRVRLLPKSLAPQEDCRLRLLSLLPFFLLDVIWPKSWRLRCRWVSFVTEKDGFLMRIWLILLLWGRIASGRRWLRLSWGLYLP